VRRGGLGQAALALALAGRAAVALAGRAVALALAGRAAVALAGRAVVAGRVARRRRSRGHCSGAGRRSPAVRLGAERARGRADVASWWWAPGTSA
jgi:hypothetical protein